jgi:hypothetical protein
MTITPPPGLAVMTNKRRWVGFRRETRPGESKPTKVPYQVARDERGRDQKAKAGDETTFDTFAAVAEAVAAGRFDGFGYELLIEDGLFFLDLDGVRDPETHRLTPLARSAVSLLNTYAAPSISGTGVHVYGIGQLPAELLEGGRQGRKIGNFELYAGKHFATETFQPFPGYDALREVDADTMRRLVLLLWPDEFGHGGEDKGNNVTLSAPAPLDLDDAALLAKAFDAHGGGDLYQRHHGQYLLDDKSADDFAYLGALRFWTQADPARMRRLALSSQRVRDKWHTRRGASDWLDYSIASINAKGGEVYDPGRSSFDNIKATPDADLVATLRADVQRLGDELRDRDRTIARLEGDVARLTARVGELETEVQACQAAMRHPDQAAGIGAFDLLAAADKAIDQGKVLTIAGRDFGRVPFAQAADLRSEGTLRRGFRKITGAAPDDDLREPVAFGRGQAFAAFTRLERVETATFKGEVPIAYIAIPPELRGRRGAQVLAALPEPGEKKHGGRRTIPVPEAVADQPNPVRRKRERVTKWYDALSDRQLAVEVAHEGTDFWSNRGEQLLPEEMEGLRVRAGYQPPPVPRYRPPAQPPLHLYRREEPRQDETVSRRGEPRQDDAMDPLYSRRQDDGVPPVPGACPDCGEPIRAGGYCLAHYEAHLAAHRRQYVGDWDDAAAGAD